MPVTEFSLPQRYKTNRRSPMGWIVSHILHNWYIPSAAVVASFINALLMSIVQLQIGKAYNTITATTVDIAVLGGIALVIVVCSISRGIMQLVRNGGFELTAQRIERNVREELYVNLLGKSMTFHNLQPIGDTMARATNDVRQVNFLFSPGLSQVIGSFNFLIMPLIVAPSIHPSLFLTPVIFIVLYFLALWEYLHTLRPIADDVRQSFGNLNTRLAEALDGIETVKGAAQEKSEVKRFIKNASKYRDAAVRQGNIEARFLPLLLLSMAYAGGLFHALMLYRFNIIDMGQVISYFGLLLMLDFPVFTSLWAYSLIASGLAGGRRILELMNRENNLDQNLTGHTHEMMGEIEFRNVSFGYDGKEPVLDRVSFKVRSGQTVAIVGQTGSSKTTLAKLINRTYDVTHGKVLVDGVDVRDWNLESLRRNISIIEQDIFLFSRSISDNIAFGKQHAGKQEIENAARAAQADEFIRSFKKGYKTVIGERGVTLSGGQRQRLALARAFLTDPRILVLDDSTSAIDSATEDLIQRAIFTAARGRTTFIITHRLSQIRWADVILVMRKGRLVASGSHDDLMKKSEAYRRIFSET
jgi:ATP-binding cassette, subfamily B, bacterial